MRINNSLFSIIPIFLLCLVFYNFLSSNLNSINLFDLLQKFPSDIGICLFLILIAYILRFFRWRFVLNYLGHNPPLFNNLLIWISSFAFAATPARSGELFRCVLLKKKCGIDKSSSFAALIFERITDSTALLLIFVINLPLLISWNKSLRLNIQSREIYLITFIILMISSIIFFFKKNLLIILNNSLSNFFINKFNKIKIISMKKLSVLLKPKVFITATLVGIMAWFFEGIIFFILLKAFNANINIEEAIVSQLASGLFGAISFMPGGIGTTEASAIGILLVQNINIKVATSTTILSRLISLWSVSFIGLICLFLILKKPNIKEKSFM